ncbi:cytochrome c3 family protein [Anaeromyxobacter paludicola]|uniref:Cytochrome c7-like domain-containing protein n=1 Tax=Anaeromyxobacter paludicola TaxID=2918171 RepID=A0ABM7X9C8_9BACT|nr:cytochrome c3 family protein [Anaeromyxobacter paludicola]BDG08454.1 hypothetical protein AMPC_15670 [Anaeromyxobacter paludicola]
MRTRSAFAVLLAAALVGPALPGASAAAAPPARHPEVAVGGAETCASCHAEVTPAAARAWRESRHGLDQVKCFACHGSTGADFRRHPEPARCQACHAREVDSVTQAGATRDCFACHPSHALLPAKGKSPHVKK